MATLPASPRCEPAGIPLFKRFHLDVRRHDMLTELTDFSKNPSAM